MPTQLHGIVEQNDHTAVAVRSGPAGPASGDLVFQHKKHGWGSAQFLTGAWYKSDGTNSACAIVILRTHAYAANPLTYKGPDPIDFCLQGTLSLFIGDGPVPMRPMGATTYDSGPRCIVGYAPHLSI